MIKSKFKFKKFILGILSLILILVFLPLKSASAKVEEIKDDTDMAKINTYQFNLNVNNYTIVSKSDAVEKLTLRDAVYEGEKNLKGPMDYFAFKVDKSKKQDQIYDNPLELKFTNVGEVYGKKVDAYVKFNRVKLNYLNTEQASKSMDDPDRTLIPFFSISEYWEKGSFEIGNVFYTDATHSNKYIRNAFWNDADVTAELRFSDGSETNLKLVMRPSDVDVNYHGLRETFYIKNYETAVNKRVMNKRNILEQVTQGDTTYWKAAPGPGTEGSDAENNETGLAVRSVNNKLNFGYSTTEHCSTIFGLFVEGKIPPPVKSVDKEQALAKVGEQITYTADFKVPTPGKDVIGPLSNLSLVENLDERLDFKDLKVE